MHIIQTVLYLKLCSLHLFLKNETIYMLRKAYLKLSKLSKKGLGKHSPALHKPLSNVLGYCPVFTISIGGRAQV